MSQNYGSNEKKSCVPDRRSFSYKRLVVLLVRRMMKTNLVSLYYSRCPTVNKTQYLTAISWILAFQ